MPPIRLAALSVAALFVTGSAFAGRSHESSSSRKESSSSSSSHASASHDSHWTYDGETGPTHWAELSPEFQSCSGGRQQTPVDINVRYADVLGLDDIVVHYHPSHGKLENNGHTIQVGVPGGNAIEVDGVYYELAQLHFHAPSEHRLNGKQYPMEMHLVHKDATGHLAVVGVFIEEGAAGPAYEPIFAEMAVKTGQVKDIEDDLDLASLLPPRHDLVRYSGSLTTPPCTEGVRWNVFTDPVTLSAEQIGRFKKLYDNNARPIQALNGRHLVVDATP